MCTTCGPSKTISSTGPLRIAVMNSPFPSFLPLSRNSGFASCWLSMTSKSATGTGSGRANRRRWTRSCRIDTNGISSTGVSRPGGLATWGVGLSLVSESQIIPGVRRTGRCRDSDLGGLLVSESNLICADVLLLRISRGDGLSVDSESKSSAPPGLDRAAGGGLALESESVAGIWVAAGGESLARGDTARRSALDSESESDSTRSTRRRLHGRGRFGELSLDESKINVPAGASAATTDSGLDSESIWVSAVGAGIAITLREESVFVSGSVSARFGSVGNLCPVRCDVC